MKLSKLILIGTVIGLLLMANAKVSALKPSKIYSITPDSLRLVYKTLSIESAEGIKLNAWVYSPNPEKDKKTTIILAYPDAGNMSNYVYQSAYLAYSGFTVVTFDYRGFGNSSEFEIQPDYLYYNEFCDDLVSVVNKIKSESHGRRVGIWALSMGTIITTRAYDRIKSNIDFIIGDSYVVDTDAFVERVNRIKNQTIQLPPTETKYSEIITHIDTPILIFSGTEDIFTTTQDANALKEKLGSKCTVIEYKGNHLEGFTAIPDKANENGYVALIVAFLNKM